MLGFERAKPFAGIQGAEPLGVPHLVVFPRYFAKIFSASTMNALAAASGVSFL